ncbi:MAG: hypothetical protein RMJ97_12010 [Raineya sp.]|nr:hypothetical protein [Raineya sp.]MDW8297596.1 hypothetical protein [Raineya sp.]
MNNKKQIALLLGILIIPAFIFVLFQGSLKNYYNLPKLSREGEKEPFRVQTSTIPQKNTFWIVGLDKEKSALSDSLFNVFSRIAQKEDLRKFLAQKLPDFQVNFQILGRNLERKTPNIITTDEIQVAEKFLLSQSGEATLIDNEGWVRGKYTLIGKNKMLNPDEIERLITEIKVLVEIVANPKKK